LSEASRTFFERYDSDYGEEIPRLEPFARGLYHVRNRWLDPNHGRWTTRDPNATGQISLGMVVHHGRVAQPGVGAFNAGEHFSDGIATLQYTLSEPLSNTDALGLFSLGEVNLASSQMVDVYSDYAQNDLDAGIEARGTIQSILYGKSLDNMFDVYWAEDWSRSDDDYSSAGVTYIDAQTRANTMSRPGHVYAGTIPTIAGYHKHHIITKYSSTGKRIVEMLERKGLSKRNIQEFINSAENLMHVPAKKHGPGRHKNAYHDMIYNTLKRDLNGLTGSDAYEAMKKSVQHMRGRIRSTKYDVIKSPISIL
jgi:hypothetical protein